MADSIAARVDSLLKASDNVVSKLEEEHLALRTIVEKEFSVLLQAVQQRKQAILEAVDKERQARLAQVEDLTNQCKEMKDCHSNSAVDSSTDSSQDELEQLLAKPLPHTKYGVLVGTWNVMDMLHSVRVLPAQVYTVGSELPVQILSAVSTVGRFAVRVVHPPGEQEACLRDISDMISYDLGREPTPPISEPRPGDLCCARYYSDNKWYRARVESIPQSGKVKVLLLDFGSIQDASTNELLPLKDKYQHYPFQVLTCALSEDPLTLSREAKWKFGDEVRSGPLTVNIIKELNGGHEYVVSLWKHSPHPVSISDAVLQMSRAKEAQRKAHPIFHRDVRLKDALPTPGTSSKEAPPPNQRQRPKPIPDVQEPKPDVQEPKPDVQEPKPDVQEPKPDVQEPKPDVQEPKPDVQEPKPDVQEPKPDVEEPKPDVQEPKPDVQEPKPDVEEPKPDVQEPKPDVQEPKPDVQEPKPDVQEPKPDVQEPKSDVQEPKPDVQEPKPDVQEPKPDVQEPKPDVQEPKSDVQEPKSDVQEPKPDVQEPKPDVQEPKSDVQEPKPNLQRLKTDVQECKPNVQEPKPDVQEPKPDVQEPIRDVQEPKPDVQEPKPNLQGAKPDVQKPRPLVLQGLKPDVQKPRPLVLQGLKPDVQKPRPLVLQGLKPDVQKPKPLVLQGLKPDVQKPKPDLQDSALRPGGMVFTAKVPTNSASSVIPRNTEMGPNQPKSRLKGQVGEGGKHSSMVDTSKQSQQNRLTTTARSRAEIHQTDGGKVLQRKGTIDLHPSVRKGHQVSLVVVSELSSCGEFWAQVAIEEEEEEEQYKSMAEQLQISVQKYFNLDQPPWPCGAICAARYTEDRIWYRAQVEAVSCDSHVTVRYIDFGNAEEIPAMKCSISLEEDQRVTSKMCQKFNELTQNSEEDPVKAKVVAISNNTAFVQLLMEFEGRDPIDLNEEVLLSDLNAVGQLEFSLTPLEPPPGLGSWADRMDELMSPSDLLPEVSYVSQLTPKEDVSREKSPLDWLSTPDEEKGAVGETFSFNKKQRFTSGEWSSEHPNRAGLARLFQSSLRGVHAPPDDGNSTGKQDRVTPLTLSCEAEMGRRGRMKGAALRKDRRHHASDPSLAGSENWDEEMEEQGGGGGENGSQRHTHMRADSPWEGSHIKLYVAGLCPNLLSQQVADLFQPDVRVHSINGWTRHCCFVTVDRDGYEDKLKELNGKVIKGITSGARGLLVEVSKKKKRNPKRDGWKHKRT